jgi:hypothetical protein
MICKNCQKIHTTLTNPTDIASFYKTIFVDGKEVQVYCEKPRGGGKKKSKKNKRKRSKKKNKRKTKKIY